MLSSNCSNEVVGSPMAFDWISGTGSLNRIDEITRKCRESTGKVGDLSAARKHFD